MRDELEWVRSLRPPVDEPGDHAREQALLRLEQAIAAEPADASRHRSARVPNGARRP